MGGEGDAEPLLFSVRSGAAVSMPGMLETVLNIGLNKSVCEKIAAANGGANKRFAYDAYRRLLDMFGSVVFEMDRSQFEMELERVKEKKRRREGYRVVRGRFDGSVRCVRTSVLKS